MINPPLTLSRDGEARSGAPKVLALDISKTRTGIAEGRVGETPRSYSLSGSDVDVPTALGNLGQWLGQFTAVDPPDWIYFEAPLDAGAFRPSIDWDAREVHSHRDPHTTLVLAKLTGIVEFVARMRSIPARPANVKSVRVAFIGHGNLKGPIAKKQVQRMCKLLGWSPANDDEADALAVWYWACTQVAPNWAHVITPMQHRAAEPPLTRVLR